MRHRRRPLLLVMLALVLSAAVPATAQERPVLEAYTLDSLNDPRGLYYSVYDRSFGGGTADVSLKLTRVDSTSTLAMKVTRKVPSGGIAFALLVDRIHVVGYSGDEAVYERDLVDFLPGGIMFGDSQPGRFVHRFEGIPPETNRIVLTVYGNYE